MEKMDSPDIVDRLTEIMTYVAAHTRDQWARDYLVRRLQDSGFSVPQSVWDSQVEPREPFRGGGDSKRDPT